MDLIKVVDPKTNIKGDVEKNHIVFVGGERITYTVNNADSWDNILNNAMWSVVPPSDKTIIDRNIKIRAYFEVVVDQPLDIGTHDALRQMPLSSLIDVTQAQINGEAISDNTGSTLHAMLCYGNDAETRDRHLSESPAMPDCFQNYEDQLVIGNGRSPLNDYGETGQETPRGGFDYELSEDLKTLRCVVTEPLFLSPFQQYQDMDEGFINVNSLRVSLRFKSKVDRILSHAINPNVADQISTVDVKFTRAPELLINYITPSITQPLPELQVLPYHQMQQYIRNVATIPVGEEKDVLSDTIRLSVIPEKIYLFVSHSEQTKGFNVSDSFCPIKKLSVSWGNQSGLFSSASRQQLYRMSQENGLNYSFPAFKKYRGSVICLRMGKDIGLQANEAPGVNGSYNIQVSMTVENTSSDDYEPTFYMCVCNTGTFSIGANSARASIGNLSGDMVLSARGSDAELDYHQAFAGGSAKNFFQGLKRFAHKVSGVVGKLAVPIGSALGHPEMGAAVKRGADLVQNLTRGGRLSGGRM
jgi:hypothetical protein